VTKVVKAVRRVENKVMGKLQKSGSVGRSIAKVIQPMLDAKNKVRDEVGRFGRSKLGKIVITAVAIYFGGAALAGAMGGGAAAATGATGWAGAAQGLSGAWTGVMQAGSALAAGEVGAAGTALSTGAAGGSAAGTATAVATPSAATMAVPEVAAAAGGAATPAASLVATGQASTAPLITANVPAVGGAVGQAGAGGGGMLASVFNSRTAPAFIQAGAGMLSSAGQAKTIEAMQEREDEKEDDRLKRYNTNVGTRLWG